MKWPTGTEVALLRQNERNFSKIYLGVQRGKERASDVPPPLMIGHHYQLVAGDVYDANEHTLTFGVANFLLASDIRPNMTVACGTLADPFLYGSARVREVDIANNRLNLEPNNLSAEGYFATGDYIWIDGVYRLYRKLPYIVAGVVFEDGNPDTLLGAAGIPGRGIAFSVNYLDRPVALMGCPRVAWTGEYINFYGWRSHGRGGNTIANYTWNFDGGEAPDGINLPGVPATPVRARWLAAGEYIASLTVTDNSAKVGNDDYGVPFTDHRAVRPVLVYDKPGEGPNVPYSDFKIESLDGKYGSGWTCKVTVFGTADKSEFPDNSLIIIFAEDWYGNVEQSIGGWYGQENILFVGYIRGDSVKVDFEKSEVSFEASTIEQWMKDIDVWPANFVSTVGAPARWHEFQAMAVEDVCWYLSEFRSNLKDVTDCFFCSDPGAAKALGFIDITEASLYDQLSSQIGSCFFGQVSASRHGSVHLFKHKNMLDLAERVLWGPPVYSFQKQDWAVELSVGEERQRDSVAQIDFIGFIYNANGDPLEVYSLAPERQTNFGMIERVDGVLLSGNTIVAAQPEANTLSGLYRAWKNIRIPNVSLQTRLCNRFLEPATLDYFAIELAATDTVRGYVWAGKEFLTTGISLKFDHENGTITVGVDGEESTWGPDGVAGPYPADPPTDDPPDEPPEYWGTWPPQTDGADDPPPWGIENGGPLAGMIAYLGLASGHVIRGTKLGRALGYECSYYNCGLVHTDGISWMALDEFDPVNTAMVCTPYRIYKTTNLSDDNPTWSLVLGPLALGEMHVVRSSAVQRGLWMVCGYTMTNIYVWWSVNGGATWNSTSFTSGDADGAYGTFLELSTHDANRAWVMWVDDANLRTYVATTEDMWSSQTLAFIPTSCFNGNAAFTPRCHHRNYDNEDDSERIYGGSHISGATDYTRIYRNAVCTTLYTDPTNSAWAWMRAVGCGIGTANRWWALAGSVGTQGFLVSDGGAWTEQRAWPSAVNGLQWYLRDGRNYRSDWRWYALTRDGTSYPVTITIDRGVSWSPQFGNWPAFTVAEGLGDPNVIVICSSKLLP